MKQSLALIGIFLCMSFHAQAQSKTDQDNKTSGVRVNSTAEIIKIDSKKNSFQVMEMIQPNTSPRRRQAGERRGGGRNRGGIGFPRSRTGGGGGSPSGGPTVANQKKYKVFVTKNTALDFAGAKLDFSDFHVGDRITISGTPKGSKGDLEATKITREN
jgi:hypothetical protein